MSRSIVAKIIPETCNAFWDVLKDEFMSIPTRSTWEKIAADYDYFWQFPNCVGSIDGKHVTMQAPKNAGSLYYNYKKQHSLILLAVVDAQYNFVAVDIGGYGKQSDGSVFSNSAIGRLLKSQNLDLPVNEPLSRSMRKTRILVFGNCYLPAENENSCFAVAFFHCASFFYCILCRKHFNSLTDTI